jgi:hypothetical protein
MCILHKKYERFSGLFPFIALMLYCNIAYPQVKTARDTLIKIPQGALIHIKDSISFFSTDTVLKIPDAQISSKTKTVDKNIIFYDSLKAKASKNHLMKKLYDLVVISPDTIHSKRITKTSDAGYKIYSGEKIRNIEIKRLNVFGVDINNPAVKNTSRFYRLLNNTHVNTNESIIRKNLLFSAGDTVSPLTLSDNERILRQLPYIDDARIMVVPVSDDEVDIIVLTKDVYSLGGSYTYKGFSKGEAQVFEKNVFGMGHEFGIDIPFNNYLPNSPGFGVHYTVDNIARSFINLNLFYLTGLGETTYGFGLSRKLVSSTSKYAGGISVRQMYTTEDLDTLPVPQPLKYNFQDYWLSRSFLIDKESVSRVIFGARYTNNNVFDHPFILPDSYYDIQKYRIFLTSAAISVQKFYKTSLIYNYGRTEDIPYGTLFKITAGREFNEFKNRTYLGTEIAFGKAYKKLGYFYTYAGLSTFINGNSTEQGVFAFDLKYFSNLLTLGKNKIRNFVNINYSRGFNRNTDEFLAFYTTNGFSGFKNDTITGNQRLTVSLESVMFSSLNLYNFKFAFFGFTDFSLLSATNEMIGGGRNTLSSIGLGVRVRNDNLIFNTLQIRLAFYLNLPPYSDINHLTVSGEQLLRPNNFDPGPPSIIPYK